MFTKKITFSVLMIFSIFSNVFVASMDQSPSQCFEKDCAPVICGVLCILLCCSVSNDYKNYVNKNKAKNSSLLTAQNQSSLHAFSVSSVSLASLGNQTCSNPIFDVCPNNSTQVRQLTSRNLKFMTELKKKNDWDKLSPVQKKKVKRYGKYN